MSSWGRPDEVALKSADNDIVAEEEAVEEEEAAKMESTAKEVQGEHVMNCQ